MPFDVYDLLLLILFMTLLVLGFLLWHRSRGRAGDPFPYQLHNDLDERLQQWLALLEAAVGERCRVRPQVPLADLLHPRDGLTGKQAELARQRLEGKRVEFVLYRPQPLQPLGALLLRTHRNGDLSREQALLAAGLPVVRLDAKHPPTAEQLRQQLGRELQIGFGGKRANGHRDWVLGSVDVPLADDEDWQLGAADEAADQAAADQEDAAEICPDCGAPLQLRRATRGHHAGKEFQVCSRFPGCRRIRPVD
jgi:Protein of unknown function (DUF2726)